jgi:hypothetical protein
MYQPRPRKKTPDPAPSAPPRTGAPGPRARYHSGVPDDARARLDAALRPFALDTHDAADGPLLTERRLAAAARDAADVVLPVLGPPVRSPDRVRRLLRAVFICPWSEFEEVYAATLDALLALPPALEGVEEPTWDAGLSPAPVPPRAWVRGGRGWKAPRDGSETVGPAGTVGRVVRRDGRSVLITADARAVLASVPCTCESAARGDHPDVPFELVHLRRDGTILDVTVGTACGTCRGPRR